MKIIDALLGRKSPAKTGLLLDDPADLERLPRHELFAGGGAKKDWTALMPPFRNQGASWFCTAYAGTSIASAFEKAERGSSTLFSPYELFYRSGGQPNGNYLVRTAEAMSDGLVLEDDKPTPKVDGWNAQIWAKLKDGAKASDAALKYGRQFAVKRPAVVKTDKASLRAALADSPLMVAIGIGSDYWAETVPKQDKYSAYHAVVLADILQGGEYLIFDSLAGRGGFDGFHKLASDYEILSAISSIDLPDDWEAAQRNLVEQKYPGALSQYGKRRVLEAEKRAAGLFKETLKAHPTLVALAGRYWTAIVNALAYGGYSETDILNHLTSLRRTGKGLFDLDKTRKWENP